MAYFVRKVVISWPVLGNFFQIATDVTIERKIVSKSFAVKKVKISNRVSKLLMTGFSRI